MNPLRIRPAARGGPICVLLLVAGCGYGAVSPEAYRYAQALYAITNRQDVERLEKFRAQLDQSLQAGTLSQREARWLLAIADQGESGDWADAQAAARRMMEDQVRR